MLNEINLLSTFEEVRQHAKTGIPAGKSTGWPGLDQYFKFPYYGQLSLITGYPGSGKSEWCDSLALYCSLKYNWKVYIYSPQNFPSSFHVEKLLQKFTDKPFFAKYNQRGTPSEDEINRVEQYLFENWTFIDGERRITIQDILLDLQERIKRDRIDMVVIDPWNVLKQNRKPGQNKTDFLEEWLPVIEDFARVNNIHFFIVAHPSKPERHRGVVQQMTMYDVEDSRHWADMISNIFIVNRTQEDKEGDENKVDIRIAKIKDGRYGKCGVHTLYYRPWSGNYEDSTR